MAGSSEIGHDLSLDEAVLFALDRRRADLDVVPYLDFLTFAGGHEDDRLVGEPIVIGAALPFGSMQQDDRRTLVNQLALGTQNLGDPAADAADDARRPRELVLVEDEPGPQLADLQAALELRTAPRIFRGDRLRAPAPPDATCPYSDRPGSHRAFHAIREARYPPGSSGAQPVGAQDDAVGDLEFVVVKCPVQAQSPS